MLRIYLRVVLLALAVLVANILLFCLLPPITTSATASIIDKHARLESLGSPKIVIVGGSGIAFGVDSYMIEERTGYAVVNMGLNAGLGLRYILAEVLPQVGEGDIVLVIPEYPQLDTVIDGDAALRRLVHIYPPAFRWLSKEHIPALVKYHPTAIRSEIIVNVLRFVGRDPNLSHLYQRSSFDSRGDFVAHLGNDSSLELQAPCIIAQAPSVETAEAMAELESFRQDVQARGGQVFFAFPAIPRPCWEASRDAIAAIQQLVATETHLQMLGDSGDAALPVEQFFDTRYHLNAVGRQRNTLRLLDSLIPLLPAHQ